MDNRMIVRYVRAFQETRQDWLDRLVANPDSTQACQHILSINSKIELLLTLWNWSDESVDFPH